MSELPTGTVTFLFTDVEGSTRLLEEHGERYADLLEEHRRVLRAAFARHADVEVDTQADAFFVAFSSAADALAAADEAQRQLELLRAHWLLQLACSERCVDLTGGSTRSPRRPTARDSARATCTSPAAHAPPGTPTRTARRSGSPKESAFASAAADGSR
jgi:hypothetical protein